MSKEEYPPEVKSFLEGFENRFDSENKTCCDYHDCKERLSPLQVQFFMMPNLEVKVFCFQHLLASLYRFDKEKFIKIVNKSYPPIQRGAIKMYFEMNYSN